MKRVFFILGILFLTIIPFASIEAASNICTGSTCKTSEVGPFMEGIAKKCGNEGTCSLVDIMQVFANVGNWILGITGGLVLLAYVIGGFFFLISGAPGMEKMRQRGKDAIKTSTIGLVIIFVAYTALFAVKAIVTGQGITSEKYVVCGPGNTNAGATCDLNSFCSEVGTCISQCEFLYADNTITETTFDIDTDASSSSTFAADCIDIKSSKYADLEAAYPGEISCQTDLCPGNKNVQCCQYPE